jgi:uncharacterized protein
VRPRLFSWTTPFAFAGVVVLGLLIFILGESFKGTRHPLVTPPPVAADWFAQFPQRIDRITAALQTLRLPVALPAPQLEPQGGGDLRWTMRRYRIILPRPGNPEHFDALFDPIRDLVPGMVVHVVEKALGTEVMIGVEGLRTHSLQFEWLNRKPRVAIVIDELGDDLLLAREFAALEAQLTFGVWPFRAFSDSIAERLSLAHREVLIHLPMEGAAGENSGTEADLKVALQRDDVLANIDRSLAALPHAVGACAPPQSRFSADQQHMQWTFERLAEQRLFFLDVAPVKKLCAQARESGVRCVENSDTIDKEATTQTIEAALEKMIELAKVRGDQVAVAPAQANTLDALNAVLPRFSEQQVDIVPLSQLLPVSPTVETH